MVLRAMTSTRVFSPFLLTLVALIAESRILFAPSTSIVNKVDEKFLSFTLDHYLLQAPKWKNFNFSSPLVFGLMKALSPAYLRFGGTPADWCLFTDVNPDLLDKLETEPPLVALSRKDLLSLARLSFTTGNRLLWDFNLQLRYGTDWDPSNAMQMLSFLSRQGYASNFDFELGNEPNLFGTKIHSKKFGHAALNGTQIGKDFLLLHRSIRSFPEFSQSIIVGPDLGGISDSGNMLSSFINTSGPVISAVTFHHYYFDGRNASPKQYVNIKYFDQLRSVIEHAFAVVRSSRFPNKPVWIGETSDAYNSGTPNISNRFISSFLWLDKLGLAARMGIKVVMRQDFYGHYYPLIDEDLLPNPDYWLCLLHKRLVGQQVLDVVLSADSLNGTGGVESSNSARFYAHCTNKRAGFPAGSITLFGLNVSPRIVKLHFDTFARKSAILYSMLPSNSDILSRSVLLNGQKLFVHPDGRIPPLSGKPVAVEQPFDLLPFSYFFAIFPDVHTRVCLLE